MVFLELRTNKGNHIAKMPESKKSDRQNQEAILFLTSYKTSLPFSKSKINVITPCTTECYIIPFTKPDSFTMLKMPCLVLKSCNVI